MTGRIRWLNMNEQTLPTSDARECTNERTELDGWMDGWMAGWLDGMNERKKTCRNTQKQQQ